MELLQIFDRTTGTWSERFKVTAGYSESFVLDKTTDSAKDLRIKMYDCDEPNFKPNDWVRLLHVATADEAMTYDSNGIPTNSTQYLIKDLQKDYDESNQIWTIDFVLKEPIERFNGVLGETETFTNQTQKVYSYKDSENNIVTTTYYKARYNHYTALKRWLMTTPANCDTYKIYLSVGDYVAYRTIKIKYNFVVLGSGTINFSTGETLTITRDIVSAAVVLTDSLSNVIFSETISSAHPFCEYTFDNTFGYISSSTYDLEDAAVWFVIHYTKEYGIASNQSWYNRIKILDEDWLKTLDFADDTYNELNLYNVLMDNFDSSTGRTPVAYFDINPATDLPYNLERDEYILKFERQDGFDKDILSYEALIAKNIGLTITQEDSNFATGLVCNAENLSGKSNVNYPAQGLYAVPEVDTDNRDISVSPTYTTEGTDNWILRVPFPIKTVTKLEKVLLSGTLKKDNSVPLYPEYTYTTNVTKADRSEFLKEKQEYLAADEDSSGSRWCWYETGSNIIHLRNMFFNQNDSCTIYYIEYQPLPSARLSFGDNEYVTQINQNSSQIDSDKFAKYANEYLGGMNKADVIIGKYYYQYSEFSDLIGSRVEKDGKLYMITQIAYKNIGVAGYNVFLQLNENHMRKNNAYTAPQTIRNNTAIATSNIKNRLSVIKQVIKVGAVEQTATGYQFLKSPMIAMSALRPNTIASTFYPQVALFKGYSKLFTDSGLTTTSDFNIVKLANIAKLQSGNQVNLLVTYFDNSDAGKYKELDSWFQVGSSSGKYYYFCDPRYQIPALYSDPFGELQKVSLIFSSIATDAFNEGEYTNNLTIYNNRLNALKAMAALPNVSAEMQTELETNSGVEVENLQYYKDMLEKFNMNVTIELKADKDCIVCGGLLELSRLLNLTDTHTVYFELYSVEQSENDGTDNRIDSYIVDSTDGYIESYTILHSSVFGAISYDDRVAIVNNTKSIVIKAGNKKMLIFNNISDTIKSYLLSNSIYIYYA